MVDVDNKVVVIVINGSNRYVLFQSTGGNWSRLGASGFSAPIAELGSVEIDGVLQSDILTFTVGEVDYSFNIATSVITPALEVE